MNNKEITNQAHPLITPEHLRRVAVVYIRQSSEEQVRDHTGSTEFQRSLVEIARTLGWPDSRIEMMDEDLGRSGSSSDSRTGWQRLQTMIEADQVGAVFVANISRLSRQVLDFELFRMRAAIHNTLLYFDGRFINPADSNDTFVSQVLAMMAQFENRQRAENMARARMAKAKRGEVVSRLPVGWTKLDGKHDYDPETKDTIRLVIDTFWQTRSLGRTVKTLAKNGVQIPARQGHRLVFKEPTIDRVKFILTNPAYAGTYIYGLSTVQLGDPVLGNGKSRKIKLPEERWIKIPDHHPRYMTVEEQKEIKSILKKNNSHRHDRAGRGRALCQGLLRCAVCGMTLKTQYPGKTYEFVCTRPRLFPAEKPCTCFCSLELDRFVVREVLKILKAPPLEILKAALEGSRSKKQTRLDWIKSERERLAHELQLAEERAAITRDKLQRVHFAALEKIEHIREEQEQFEKKVAPEPTPSNQESEEEIEELCRIASDVPELWNHLAMTHQERKEILRCLIDHIVVAATKDKLEGTIYWKAVAQTPFLIWRGAGVLNLIRELHAQKLTTREIQQHLAAGKTSTGQVLTLCINKICEKLKTLGLKPAHLSADYLALGQKACDLRREGLSPASIAQHLNDQGFTTISGKPWSDSTVKMLLRAVGRKDQSLNALHRALISEARLRGLTYKEIAREFNEKKIPRFGTSVWTARSVWTRWTVLKRLRDKRPPKKLIEVEESELTFRSRRTLNKKRHNESISGFKDKREQRKR